MADAAKTAPTPLTDAEKLVLQLIAALPKESRVSAALEEITSAAAYWSNELVTYIAKSSDDYNDAESAANQRSNAEDINAAIKLLAAT